MQIESAAAARNRAWIKALVAIVVLAIAAVGYFSLSTKQTAPEVTFTSLTGEKVSMQSLRGKVVMVNFWATSCTTCVKEMPEMVHTYDKYKDKGLDFVAVAMSYDPPNYVLNYAQTRKLPFKVALDPQGDLAKSFGETDADHFRDRQERQCHQALSRRAGFRGAAPVAGKGAGSLGLPAMPPAVS
jgi:peroxiredoxin